VLQVHYARHLALVGRDAEAREFYQRGLQFTDEDLDYIVAGTTIDPHPPKPRQ
jgi:hypothetical protein